MGSRVLDRAELVCGTTLGTVFPVNVAQELKAFHDGGRGQAPEVGTAMPPFVAQSSLLQPIGADPFLQMAVLRRQASIDARVTVVVFLARLAQGNGSLAGVRPGRGEEGVEGLSVGWGRRDKKQDEEEQEEGQEASLCPWWICHWPVFVKGGVNELDMGQERHACIGYRLAGGHE